MDRRQLGVMFQKGGQKKIFPKDSFYFPISVLVVGDSFSGFLSSLDQVDPLDGVTPCPPFRNHRRRLPRPRKTHSRPLTLDSSHPQQSSQSEGQ